MAKITINGKNLPESHATNEFIALMTRTDSIGATAAHTLEKHGKVTVKPVEVKNGKDTGLKFDVNRAELDSLMSLLKVKDDAMIVIQDNGKESRERSVTWGNFKTIIERTLTLMPWILQAEKDSEIKGLISRVETPTDGKGTTGKSVEVLEF